MEAADLAHRRGCEAVGIFVAEIRLLHEGEFRQVLQRDEVARLDAFLVAPAAEEGDMLVFVGDKVLKLRQLERAELFGRHEVRLAEIVDVFHDVHNNVLTIIWHDWKL